VTDFVQMIILVAGLLALAYVAADLIGGVQPALDYVSSRELDNFWPAPTLSDVLFFISAALTMMLGSIPQQDVFQRVMSAKDIKAATWGPVIGGVLYILFAFIPIFLVVAAMIVMPEKAEYLLAEDPQKILPSLIVEHMPFAMQVVFFGALLSAIMSTASATLLAPSVTFNENIWRHIRPTDDSVQQLKAMRITVFTFGIGVLLYAISMEGSSIYKLVSGAYQVTMVGAFIPLTAGLFWRKATTQGAWLSILLGIGVWLILMQLGLDETYPAPLSGLLASAVGMVIGSLAPQWVINVKGEHHPLA
jgi:Na+/proline symporter